MSAEGNLEVGSFSHQVTALDRGRTLFKRSRGPSNMSPKAAGFVTALPINCCRESASSVRYDGQRFRSLMEASAN